MTDFLSSPSVGASVTNGINTWIWNGQAWDKKVGVTNMGLGSFMEISPVVELSMNILPMMATPFFLINYV